MTPVLTKMFDEPERKCREETRALSSRLRSELLNSSQWPIPLWEPELWPQGRYINCYNFAVNTKSVGAAVPGSFSSGGHIPYKLHDLHERHLAAHQGALRDGLIFLSDKFHEAAANQKLCPVALFMRPTPHLDFHWAALRRKGDNLFWTMVPGLFYAAKRIHFWQSIFSTAAKNGYSHFGGYYGVPDGKTFNSFEEPRKGPVIKQPDSLRYM